MNFESFTGRLRESGQLLESRHSSANKIGRLVIDSREAGPSDCFVAINGSNVDGHLFIDKAVKNGATAIVCEAGPAGSDSISQAGPAYARVENSRRALAELASLVQSDPGTDLQLFAVTGTNGKTTIASIVQYVLESTGHKSGLIGTTGYQDGSQFYEASHTTPSAIRVYELLSGMVKNGCTHCSMELSSHAIDQDRIRFSDVNVALFTNLTRDHLDYHETFDSYLEAKKHLFDELPTDSTAITNLDDPNGLNMIHDTRASVLTCASTRKADVTFSIESNLLSGIELTIDGMRRRFRLAGTYNAFNLAAAYAVGRSLGIEAQECIEALSACPPIAGRFERLQFQDSTIVIVDYAHTPDALKNVLEATRQGLGEGATLWCIFGCGGDRDRGKRPLMGAVAEQLADRVIVTSDNPREEDPIKIMDDIRDGFERPENAIWTVDREDAISKAATFMNSGDTLVLAGKGHETYQVIGTENQHFDDREQAQRLFGQRSSNTPVTKGVMRPNA